MEKGPNNKLSIIIPVYNEEKTLLEIINRVKNVKLPIEKEIIIIDDSSTDKTQEILRKIKDIKLITHKRNSGKGAAIKTGFSHVKGNIVIIQDADLEYDPNEYCSLIKPILDNKADIVYGSRILKKDNVRGKLHYYLGGRLISLVASLLYLRKITDEPTCYKVFRTDIIKGLKINGNGFDFEPEVTSKLLKQRHIRYKEIPISYKPRTLKQGKKINWKDGIFAIYTLIKYRLKD